MYCSSRALLRLTKNGHEPSGFGFKRSRFESAGTLRGGFGVAKSRQKQQTQLKEGLISGGCRFNIGRGQDELYFESRACIGSNPVVGNWRRIGAQDNGSRGEVQHPILWFAWAWQLYRLPL